LPSSPTKLTSLDASAKKFRTDKVSTNSEEFLHSVNGRGIGHFDKSDLPSNLKNETTQLFSKSLKNMDDSKIQNIGDNLIQLEDSPKHSLRARRATNMKYKTSTKNTGNYNYFRFEDESRHSTSGFSPIQVKPSNNQDEKEPIARISTPCNTILPVAPNVLSKAMTTNSSSKCNPEILIPTTDVGSSIAYKSENQNIKNMSNLKELPKLPFLSNTVIFPSPLIKDKVL